MTFRGYTISAVLAYYVVTDKKGNVVHTAPTQLSAMQFVEGTVSPFIRQDFTDEKAAIEFAEKHESGRIVCFVEGFDGRERSSAMRVFENGKWRGVNIHE